MGVWRSHHSVGNMLGSLVAAVYVEYDWGLSFAVPAVVTFILAVYIFLFLVPDPKSVGCLSPDHATERMVSDCLWDFQTGHPWTSRSYLASVEFCLKKKKKKTLLISDGH